MAEALRLAEAYGVDAAKIPAALAPGHAGSNLLPVLFERMIARDFAPKGYARQVLKDLEMLHEAAGARHLAMPMAGAGAHPLSAADRPGQERARRRRPS